MVTSHDGVRVPLRDNVAEPCADTVAEVVTDAVRVALGLADWDTDEEPLVDRLRDHEPDSVPLLERVAISGEKDSLLPSCTYLLPKRLQPPVPPTRPPKDVGMSRHELREAFLRDAESNLSQNRYFLSQISSRYQNGEDLS
mgnify:CR=1 FL=1